MPKRAKKAVIDWGKLWYKFNEWCTDPKHKKRCKTCGHVQHDNLDWEDQMKKIEQLVERELPPRGRRVKK